MGRRTTWVYVTGSLFWWMLFPSCVLAQLIDTKDLTNAPTAQQATTANLAVGENGNPLDQDCFIDHFNGFVIRDVPEKLHLEIVSADLQAIDGKTQITANIRLKNEGNHAVLLPWQAVEVEPPRTGADEELKYEAAIIGLKLGTQKYRNHGARLKGEAELRADPNSYAQHVDVLPGQWVELKYTALVECQYELAGAPLCSPFKDDKHARLTAFWHEWVITEQGYGCTAKSRSDKSRMIDSPPLEIEYLSAGLLRGKESRPR